MSASPQTFDPGLALRKSVKPDVFSAMVHAALFAGLASGSDPRRRANSSRGISTRRPSRTAFTRPSASISKSTVRPMLMALQASAGL